MATNDVELEVKMDGRPVSSAEIDEVERVRAIHVLKEMRHLGADISLNGMPATDMAIETLDLTGATATLVRAKVQLGNDGIIDLYRDKIAESDETWRTISARSPMNADHKAAVVEIDANGLTVAEFMSGVLAIADSRKPAIFYGTHPEHFVGQRSGIAFKVLETMGMHGEPVLMKLRTALSGYEPVPRDPDTRVTFFAAGTLANDGTPLKLVAMHQMKDRPKGFGVKLGIFFPSATPDELVEGHKWHLAVEFSHFIGVAAAGRMPVRAAMTRALVPVVDRWQSSRRRLRTAR